MLAGEGCRDLEGLARRFSGGKARLSTVLQRTMGFIAVRLWGMRSKEEAIDG